jgi:basic membrane lipoprotein Med (substrate-binding protein (PBP1-ABC) superfamily)
MSDPNFAQQAGNFMADAEVDTVADNLINQGVDAIASHIPGGEGFEQQLRTEVDQVVNNAINNELNKGVDGAMQDVEGLFHRE